MLFIHNWYSFTFVNYWFVSSEINTWTRVDMKFLYFACHINTILARKVNFINEWNKRIDNTPQKIMKCVGARTQDEKMRRIITKTNNGRSFQLAKSQLWLGPYRQQKSFRYTAKIGLWQIFWQSIFDLSEEKCHYHSHWIRNFRFFFFYFRFFPCLEKF